MAACDGEGKRCTPGASVGCACPSGAKGAQLCSKSGESFGPCVCAGAGNAADYLDRMKSGDQLAKRGEWKGALAEFEAALAAKPDDFDALAEVGWCAVHAGDHARAREASTKAAERAPNPNKKGMALYNLGLAIESEDPKAALSLFEESLRLRPNKTVEASAQSLRRRATAAVTKEGEELLQQLKISSAHASRTAADEMIIALLMKAGAEWNSGAGSSYLRVRVTCTQDMCDGVGLGWDDARHVISGAGAASLVSEFKRRGLMDVNGKYDVTIDCTSRNEGFEPGHRPPDTCTVEARR